MVRCSHYPQAPAFLDACDELGLLVWEEPAGWQYLGDQAWKELACRDVEEMVRRDRNRPCIVIWAPRLNETADDTELYTRTEKIVKDLDGSRQTAGATHGPYYLTQDYQHDVFGYDDYTTYTDGLGRYPFLLPPARACPTSSASPSRGVAARPGPTPVATPSTSSRSRPSPTPSLTTRSAATRPTPAFWPGPASTTTRPSAFTMRR